VPRVHSGAAHAADTETIPPTKSLYFVTNVSKTEDRAQLFWGTVNPGVDMNGSRPPKAAMLVARRIVADIARDSLKPGDVLPPERTMPGPRGGPVLLDPDASHLANAVVLLMQLKEAPFRTIMEVRSALEPVISSLAAMRISDKALAELYSTIEEMGDNLGDEHTFLDANKRFTRSSPGPPIILFSATITPVPQKRSCGAILTSMSITPSGRFPKCSVR